MANMTGAAVQAALQSDAESDSLFSDEQKLFEDYDMHTTHKWFQ